MRAAMILMGCWYDQFRQFRRDLQISWITRILLQIFTRFAENLKNSAAVFWSKIIRKFIKKLISQSCWVIDQRLMPTLSVFLPKSRWRQLKEESSCAPNGIPNCENLLSRSPIVRAILCTAETRKSNEKAKFIHRVRWRGGATPLLPHMVDVRCCCGRLI